MKIYCTTERSV